MEYKIVILDSLSKQIIMDGAPVSYLGLKEVLKRFTSMNQAKYKAVIDQAWRTGSATYIPNQLDATAFSIAIVRIDGPGSVVEEDHDHIYTRKGR